MEISGRSYPRTTAMVGLVIIGLSLLAACDAPDDPQASRQAPTLAVVLIVDQMRADYLERFAGDLDGGLRRLIDEGALFSDAHHEHAMTLTGAGHATLATGCDPAHNGITANTWWDRELGRDVYSAEDDRYNVLEAPGRPGRSPENLDRAAIGDWLKADEPTSRVFSVAIKDRSAILLAGHHADTAYWFDKTIGRFTTSEYYRRDLPGWLDDWQLAAGPETYRGRSWELLLPVARYGASRSDEFPAEADGAAVGFPHRLPHGEDEFLPGLIDTPFGDEMTLSFARELIAQEELGRRDSIDLMWISASSADYLGHEYGPYSREVQDYYLRLDRMVGELLEFLDRRFGVGNYWFVLSSDHGVATMPEQLRAEGLPGRRVDPHPGFAGLVKALEPARAAVGIVDEVHLRYRNGLILLHPDGSPPAEPGATALRRELARAARELDFVSDAYTLDELLDPATPGRPFLKAYRRTAHTSRSPDVYLRMGEQVLATRSPTTTTHGSPYPHDTHVPLIFFGPGVAPKTFAERVSTVDLAPTLATLLGLNPPDDLDGRALLAPR